jgi:hypothetical protein
MLHFHKVKKKKSRNDCFGVHCPLSLKTNARLCTFQLGLAKQLHASADTLWV